MSSLACRSCMALTGSKLQQRTFCLDSAISQPALSHGLRLIAYGFISCRACYKRIQHRSSLFLISFTSTLLSSSIGLAEVHMDNCGGCAHLKFMVSGRSKQTSKHTHARVQCSHASVVLAQARPNYCTFSTLKDYIIHNSMWRGSPRLSGEE